MDSPASAQTASKKATEVEVESTPIASSSDDPPPPYIVSPSTPSSNPGFCDLAFLERQSNRLPNGGMTASQYFLPCTACNTICGSDIPSTYQTGWQDWIDPSVNFRWESHTGTAMVNGEKRELLSCWICWEFDGKWCKPMFVEEWYVHLRKHFKVDGYKACKGKVGAMQRRRNCAVANCPKIHS